EPADEPADEPAADLVQNPGSGELPGDYNLGQQVYLDDCAPCHGAQDGVGPGLGGMSANAATRVAGMTAAEYLYQSIVDPGAFLVPDYQDVMPKTFAQDLTEDEIAGLVKFIAEFDRESMMAGMGIGGDTGAAADSGAADAAAGAGIEITGETLAVRGNLVQGTANSEAIPAGLAVQLYALDAHGNFLGQYDTTSQENGEYVFENIPRAIGNIYLVQVDYAGVPQGAQIAAINGDEALVSQDITLYERTTDTTSIAVMWAQMLINYAPIKEFGLEVWLYVELANTGDRIVTTDEISDNGWLVSVPIELPVGAFGIQPMQQEGSNRYQVELVDGTQPVVKDTWPLRPGQAHTITVAYYLPYDDGAVIDQSFPYPVIDGVVLMPNDTVELRSDQFDSAGLWTHRATSNGANMVELAAGENIDPDKDFTLVRSHVLTHPLEANERMVFELVGRPTRTIDLLMPGSQNSSSNTNVLPLILGGLGGAFLVLAGVLYWRQRGTVAAPPGIAGNLPGSAGAALNKEALLRAVAALDDAYAAGAMDEAMYTASREALVEQLIPLMDEDDPS
ncbi:MAG: cytochrome c, partial [Anaerolineae bacterium]|nr:cytochrome c [Anaerolineae bacterium]